MREVADGIGLTEALSAASRPSCAAGLVHDPGAVLRDVVVTLVDGGDDLSAIEVLRGQAKLLGAVASDSTAWRRVADLEDSAAQCQHVRAVASARIRETLGNVGPVSMAQIRDVLAVLPHL